MSQAPLDAEARPMQFPQLSGIRVLVVEDDRDIRRLYERFLMTAGADVRTAASSREALEALSVRPVDVLVSDIGLPDEDGLALIKRVRETQAGGPTRAIAVSGTDDGDMVRSILASGYQACLTKPIGPVDLIQSIARVAPSQRERQS
jgi:CheY-like chemotaxis protein